MKRFWLAFITFVSAIALAACGTDSGETGGVDSAPKRNQGAADLTIVAATELKDLEGLVQQAADDLGFSIELLLSLIHI